MEIIIALLSGAIGGSLITAVYSYLSDKRRLKINLLREQVDSLYGPLYFLLLESQHFFELANKIIKSYDEYFSGRQWSDDDNTQSKLMEEAKNTIDLSNQYVETANHNNQKIFDIIKENYSLLDLDDVEIISAFLKNYSRLRIEYAADNKLPFAIYKMIGIISFLPNDFKGRIMEKFKIKKDQLANLAG